jgi:hypothetical protein
MMAIRLSLTSGHTRTRHFRQKVTYLSRLKYTARDESCRTYNKCPARIHINKTAKWLHVYVCMCVYVCVCVCTCVPVCVYYMHLRKSAVTHFIPHLPQFKCTQKTRIKNTHACTHTHTHTHTHIH